MAIKIDRVLDFCFIYTIVCDIYTMPETLLSPVLKMIGAIQPAPGGSVRLEWLRWRVRLIILDSFVSAGGMFFPVTNVYCFKLTLSFRVLVRDRIISLCYRVRGLLYALQQKCQRLAKSRWTLARSDSKPRYGDTQRLHGDKVQTSAY